VSHEREHEKKLKTKQQTINQQQLKNNLERRNCHTLDWGSELRIVMCHQVECQLLRLLAILQREGLGLEEAVEVGMGVSALRQEGVGQERGNQR
jgi:hypothetical protein